MAEAEDDPASLFHMLDDSPEKKAWLASISQAQDFAAAHGGGRMSADDQATYERMLRRVAEAQQVHEVLLAASRVVARADGYGMSVTGGWLVVVGVALTYTGAVWLVLYDVSGGELPFASLGDANTVIGAATLVPGIAVWITGVALRRSGRSRARRASRMRDRPFVS